MRVGPWKMHFATKERYYEDMVVHTMPQLFNLRKDPYEKYDGVYGFELIMHKSWVFQPAIGYLNEHLSSFKDFPPRHRITSYNVCYTKLLRSITVDGDGPPGASRRESRAGTDRLFPLGTPLVLSSL